jgi:hypothetical protein
MPETNTQTPPYDRAAIFEPNGPFNPSFMREAIHAMLRTLPLEQPEPESWSDRRMHAALLALSALHPRDEIEVLLGVQAMSAHHAAMACWYLGMNIAKPNATSTRHITAACSAARAFDTMLRALERRQAKPLSVPIGRPAPQTWEDAPNAATVIRALEKRCYEGYVSPEDAIDTDPVVAWTPELFALVEALRERERIEEENKGLDIANTEGILPGGGMILMDDPTPQQAAYMDRRLGLMYKREIEENRRNGITKMPKIRGIRPGDLIP